MDVRLREVERALDEGAGEIDVVISAGKFLEGNTAYVSEEIRRFKELTGERHLKVILETGVMPSLEHVRSASFLAMEAGADFIKTSTGKTETGATPEAVYVMCEAIKEYHAASGRAVGIKPSGGISDATTAIMYYLIVNEILGSEWLKPSRFRFGASRLANNLLGEKYF
jgi:deoxyribose-phosphate aldolase